MISFKMAEETLPNLVLLQVLMWWPVQIIAKRTAVRVIMEDIGCDGEDRIGKKINYMDCYLAISALVAISKKNQFYLSQFLISW